MISGRAAVVSVIVHAAFAGWVVSAKPVVNEVIEDAEAAPAIEVVLELEPVVTQETMASTADIAMATERTAAVQQLVPEQEPEPEPVQNDATEADAHEDAMPPSNAADIELPPLPALEPLQSSDIVPHPETAPPAPVVEAPKEVVASSNPTVAVTAEAAEPPREELREVAQPVAAPQPVVSKPKRQVAPEKPAKVEAKALPKRIARAKTIAKPLKPVAKKAAVKPKLVKGNAPVAKLAGGKSKALASKKALAAAAGRKAVASGGSAIDPGYKSRILAKLRGAKRAPKGGGSGRVVLAFTVSRSGGLLSARIVKSGGHPALDQATLAMARSAAPFPAMPASTNRASMSFTVPVQYN